ncbi:UvrABC system protein C [Striga asiatica]|uniref:UvrABC system protein C n=1 Tax=Striga asiatica TaxID=4170 RepID=A0A5A7P1V8_STRAF|nr:UvrABC system protein C [Striga asiatica]
MVGLDVDRSRPNFYEASGMLLISGVGLLYVSDFENLNGWLKVISVTVAGVNLVVKKVHELEEGQHWRNRFEVIQSFQPDRGLQGSDESHRSCYGYHQSGNFAQE